MIVIIFVMEEVSGGSSSLYFGCKSFGCIIWILFLYVGNFLVYLGMKCSNCKFCFVF